MEAGVSANSYPPRTGRIAEQQADMKDNLLLGKQSVQTLISGKGNESGRAIDTATNTGQYL